MGIIEILLKYNKELVNLKLDHDDPDDKFEEYALHTAAQHNKSDVIKLLLRYYSINSPHYGG